jgi:tRNA threonylcarbamoyladenosine biosynthesis protein TsaB
MTLYINTASYDEIIIALRQGEKTIVQKKFKAPRRQAEKLLPAIAALLKVKKVKLSDLKKIIVANHGGSFTSLRIGVITANTLAYALRIPVAPELPTEKKAKKFGVYSIVEPDYDREPTIGKAKSQIK